MNKGFILGACKNYFEVLYDWNDEFLPSGSISGWEVRMTPLRIDKSDYPHTYMYRYRAVKLDYHYPQRTEITKDFMVSEELLKVDEDMVKKELTKKAIYELKKEIIKWMMNNDEATLALQRALNYGLSINCVLK
jgi:hypothetical protein